MKLVALALVALLAAPASAAELELHLGPGENLPAIDLALVRSAAHSISMCAFVLSDHDIVAALVAARHRGVVVRIVADASEFPYDRLDGLLDITRVRHGDALMHEKAILIDGAVLRVGSENFSYAARFQTNDLVVIRDAAIAARFQAMFDALWAVSDPA